MEGEHARCHWIDANLARYEEALRDTAEPEGLRAIGMVLVEELRSALRVVWK